MTMIYNNNNYRYQMMKTAHMGTETTSGWSRTDIQITLETEKGYIYTMSKNKREINKNHARKFQN